MQIIPNIKRRKHRHLSTRTSSVTPLLPEMRVALQAWRSRMQLQRGIFWGLRGLAAGLLLAALVYLAARLTTRMVEPAPLFALAGIVFGVLAGVIYWLATAPGWRKVAFHVDRLLKLDDRLSTALEYSGDSRPVARIQREDSLAILHRYVPQRDDPLRLPRRELLAIMLGVMILALLIATPNPMVSRLQRERETAAAIQQAQKEIAQLQKEAEQAQLSPEEKAAIQKALEEAQQQLGEAKTPEEAVAALTKAENEIDRLRDPQATEKARSLDALAAALAANPDTQDLAQAIASGDQAQIDAALKALAERVDKMTPEERQKLAEELQRAANEARNQPQVSDRLRQTARALASGNTAEAQNDLQQLSGDLDNANQAAVSQAAINQVQSGVSNTRRDVVAATTGSQQQTQNGQGQEQNQQGQGQANNGQGQGQGQGQGTGQGQGQGQGNGQGQGQGSGQGQGQGTGSGAGTGQGPGTGNPNPNTGKPGESVYVPRQQGQGPSQQQNGNGSTSSTGTNRPYKEVIGTYSQNARDTIDRSNIPPNMRENVRQYFSELEK